MNSHLFYKCVLQKTIDCYSGDKLINKLKKENPLRSYNNKHWHVFAWRSLKLQQKVVTVLLRYTNFDLTAAKDKRLKGDFIYLKKKIKTKYFIDTTIFWSSLVWPKSKNLSSSSHTVLDINTVIQIFNTEIQIK